jgi:NAD(P)H-hydrate epimerase
MNSLQKNISYLNSEESKLVDEILMSPEVNYSIDQLMEIAGLSVAIAINKEIENKSGEWMNIRRILTISGPGSR